MIKFNNHQRYHLNHKHNNQHNKLKYKKFVKYKLFHNYYNSVLYK